MIPFLKITPEMAYRMWLSIQLDKVWGRTPHDIWKWAVRSFKELQ